MRIKGITVQQFLLGLALLAALCWNLAHANEIKGLDVSEGATGTRAEVRMQSRVAFRTLHLSNPERFVLDLPDTSAASLKLPPAAGVVKAVRSGQPAPGTTRIVFDLGSAVMPMAPRLETGADGVRLVVEWPGDGPVKPAVVAAPKPAEAAPAKPNVVAAAPIATAAPSAGSAIATVGAVATDKSPAMVQAKPVAADTASSTAMPQVPAPAGVVPAKASDSTVANHAVAPSDPLPAPLPRVVQDARGGTRPLIVAIDAGHGGQDPGAHGPSGKREKDVTLAIARELARQINAMPGLKAYLTRDTDVFLPLPRRTQLARQAKADLFVSIHADAAESPAARGSSVFVLSLRGASSQRARWLADKENAADLIGGKRSEERRVGKEC